MSGEDSETMARLLFANSPFRNELHQESGFEMPSMHWNEKEASSTRCFPCDVNSNLSYWYQSGTTSSSNSHFVHSSDIESYYLTDPNAVPTSNALVDFGIVEEKNNEDTNNCDHDETYQKSPHKNLANPKKRAKAPTNMQKNGKMNTKKSQKSIKMEATETKIGGSSGVCSSEDESSASQEMETSQLCSETKVTATKSKPRAARGSTNDPQSLYARKRRERINERLKILQGLVPNGTKVDISTMLEEAVQYVKFLQLQIKLLSSDDLWMYAPIAYNGMDIGLDLKISPP